MSHHSVLSMIMKYDIIINGDKSNFLNDCKKETTNPTFLKIEKQSPRIQTVKVGVHEVPIQITKKYK